LIGSSTTGAQVDGVLMIRAPELAEQRVFMDASGGRRDVPPIARPLERRLQIPAGGSLSAIQPFILRVPGDVAPALDPKRVKPIVDR
jgi:hypothetical protein